MRAAATTPKLIFSTVTPAVSVRTAEDGARPANAAGAEVDSPSAVEGGRDENVDAGDPAVSDREAATEPRLKLAAGDVVDVDRPAAEGASLTTSTTAGALDDRTMFDDPGNDPAETVGAKPPVRDSAAATGVSATPLMRLVGADVASDSGPAPGLRTFATVRKTGFRRRGRVGSGSAGPHGSTTVMRIPNGGLSAGVA